MVGNREYMFIDTCLINNIALYTYNIKDFRYIPNLKIINK